MSIAYVPNWSGQSDSLSNSVELSTTRFGAGSANVRRRLAVKGHEDTIHAALAQYPSVNSRCGPTTASTPTSSSPSATGRGSGLHNLARRTALIALGEPATTAKTPAEPILPSRSHHQEGTAPRPSFPQGWPREAQFNGALATPETIPYPA